MKSHFKLSRQQRSGIFLFLVLVILMEVVVLLILPKLKSNEADPFEIDPETLSAFKNEMDSLKTAERLAREPKIYPFNPNFITDHRGYTLGMSNEEIDRLLAYRKQDKWINSAKEFQQVTKVSDSLLNEISPYFKFPDWVNNPKPTTTNFKFSEKQKPSVEKLDLNQATQNQLEKVYGIGPALSKRIVDKRKQLGGFAAMIELSEVYGLNDEVIENLSDHFEVKTPRAVQQINLNTASRDELVTIKYIDYEVAHRIIEARTLRNGFQSLDDLAKVKGFPVNKIGIIKLYLLLE